MPDARKMLVTLRQAAALTRATPGRRGLVVHIEGPPAPSGTSNGQPNGDGTPPAPAPAPAGDVMVVGDLHGNVPGLRRILELADLDRNPRRHLVLQELVHGKIMYPEDGGDRSHQLVDAVAALKCRYPDRLHVLMGNHELAEITGRRIGKGGQMLNDLFRRGIETAYGEAADQIHAAYLELFAALPLAIRLSNRVLLCHTIPEGRDLDDFDVELLRRDVWPPEAAQRRGTVYGITWGRDVTPATVDRFAEIMDADLFVNGHQPCPGTGFQAPNHRQLILDGTGAAPAYCVAPIAEPITLDGLLERTRLAT